MNVTVKNIPDDTYQALKSSAGKQGRSLNSHIVFVLSQDAERERKRMRMVETRARLEEFVAALPEMADSTALIREDRDR